MYVRYTEEEVNRLPRMTAKELAESFERHKNDPEDPECPFVKPNELAQFHRVNKKTA